MRPILRDKEIADRLIEQAGGDLSEAGRALYNVWSVLPEETEVWSTKGLPSYVRDPRKDATFAVFGATGVNADVAASFCAELEGSTLLDKFTDDVARIAVIRSWNIEGSDPIAGLITARTLAPKLHPESFASILSQRYWGIKQHGGIDFVKSMADYGSMLEGLAQSGQLPEALTAAAQAQFDKVGGEIANIQESHRRSLLIDQAHATIKGGFNDDGYMTLVGPHGIIETIRAFDVSQALALELRANSQQLSTNSDSPLAPGVLRRQDELLTVLVSAIREQEGAQVPSDMGRAINSELLRRVQEIPTSDDERYASINQLAAQLGAEDIASEISHRRESLKYQEMRERERQMALHELGFDRLELPPQVSSLRTNIPNAHLEYEDVEDIIADIERYFVDQKTAGETHQDTTKILDDSGTAELLMSGLGLDETARIFSTMRDEMREWAASKSQEDFAHSHDDGYGTPYKYSGSPFSGNRVQVLKSEDGKKYLLNITSGGYGSNPHSPSGNLITFAEALGKTEALHYEDAPSLEIRVEPNHETLNHFAEIPEADFEPTVNGDRLIYRSSASASLSELVTWYQKILGLPESGRTLEKLSSTVVNEANTLFSSNIAYGASAVFRPDKNTQIILQAENDRTRVNEHGELHLSAAVFMESDSSRHVFMPPLTLKLTTATAIGQTERHEMVRRASLYERHVRQHEMLEGWRRAGDRFLELKAS